MEDVILLNGIKYRLDKRSGYYLCSKRAEGKRERLHRAVWQQSKGAIPEGYNIHHIDENKANNNIDNLELMLSSKHRSLHGKNADHIALIAKSLPVAREKAKEWHRSDEGKAWHTKHAAEQYGNMQTVKKVCEFCGKEYEVKVIKQKDACFCSNKCKAAARRSSGVDNIERICTHCGKPFIINKYESAETCSKSCAAHRRWTMRQNKGC